MATVSIASIMVLFMYFAATTRVQSIRFVLHSHFVKCVSEDIRSNILVVGNYYVVRTGNPSNDSNAQDVISATVRSPDGNILHYSNKVYSGHFRFTASEIGEYRACFWMPNSQPKSTVNIEIDWKIGIDAKDWASVAKKEKIDGIELELRKLESYVNYISEWMVQLRERNEEMRKMNATTRFTMIFLSFVSFIVSLTATGLQLRHLKSYFAKLKLL